MKCRLGIVVIICRLGDSSEEREIEVMYSESIRHFWLHRSSRVILLNACVVVPHKFSFILGACLTIDARALVFQLTEVWKIGVMNRIRLTSISGLQIM